ncbi:MAG: SARP family transcriptional regulator [Micromonosporaceae bacterium]|nr:SARP family transcriptional regulator [Micromonosporaceae bacterium]
MPDDSMPHRRPALLDADGQLPGPDNHRLLLRLLGGFRLEQAGRVLPIPHSARRIVAFLGIRGRCDRTEIAGTLWPDMPEAKALASLRTALWRLRRLTGLRVVDGQDALATAGTVDVDVQAFVASVRQILTTDDGRIERSPMPVLPAIGELLPGWYEDWVLFERERMRQLQMHALETVAERLTSARRYAEAIDAALAAVWLEPLRESATRALIVAHLGENNLVEAVRCFESFRDNLVTELGVQPSPELERLVQSCLTRLA